MDAFIGMIMLWAGNMIPRGWFLCDGRVLSISQYQAFYAVIGITFGGDGKNNFWLPDLRSRIPVGTGQGTGLSAYTLAEKGGVESITLTVLQLPPHNHTATGTPALSVVLPAITGSGSLPASNQPGTSITPGPALFPAQAPDYASQGLTANFIYGATDNSTKMPVSVSIPGGQNMAVSGAVANTGGGQSLDNRQPFLGLQYIIAYEGLFPTPD